MTSPSDDPVRDEGLAALYRAQAQEAPSPKHDATILAAAARELSRGRPKDPWWVRLRLPLSLAMTLVIAASLGVALKSTQSPGPETLTALNAPKASPEPLERPTGPGTAPPAMRAAPPAALGDRQAAAEAPLAAAALPKPQLAPAENAPRAYAGTAGSRAPEAGGAASESRGLQEARPGVAKKTAPSLPDHGVSVSPDAAQKAATLLAERDEAKPVAPAPEAPPSGASSLVFAPSAPPANPALAGASRSPAAPASDRPPAPLSAPLSAPVPAPAPPVAFAPAPAPAPAPVPAPLSGPSGTLATAKAAPSAPEAQSPAALSQARVSKSARMSPAQRIEEIRALKALGRYDEAAAALRELKARYPDYVLPEDLRGTP